MTAKNQFGNGPDGSVDSRNAEGEEEGLDGRVQQALTDFRASVHAWSDAAYSRPRNVEMTARRRSWRLAAGWALGCALAAGGLSGAVIEHQRQQEAARIAAAQRQARQQEAAAGQRAQQVSSLMAKVESDTSQEVPDAMEPLARMMEDGGNP